MVPHTEGWLGPPTSIIIFLKTSPQTCLQTNLVEAFLSAEVPSSQTTLFMSTCRPLSDMLEWRQTSSVHRCLSKAEEVGKGVGRVLETVEPWCDCLRQEHRKLACFLCKLLKPRGVDMQLELLSKGWARRAARERGCADLGGKWERMYDVLRTPQ